MDFATWPRVLAVDVEANGASPPDLVEVAALPVEGGAVQPGLAAAWLIRPPRPVTARATAVHGISNAEVNAAPAWPEVADEVRSMLEGAWVCAHNAHTDVRILAAHLPGWRPAGVLDTLRLARAARPDAPRYTLDALVEQAGLDLSDAPAHRHRADFDAHAAGLLLLDLAEAYPSFPRLAADAVPPGLPGTAESSGQEPLW